MKRSIQAKMNQDKISFLRIRSIHLRCFLSEFLGTFVLVTLGVGTVAEVVLSSRMSMPRGSIVTLTIGWGLAVTMGIFVAMEVSGGHLNPAFTIAVAIFRKLPWVRVPFYLAGQYFGAFLGAVAVFLVYFDALNNFDGGHRSVQNHVNATAGIWATYPQTHVSTLQAFIDQILATGLLCLLAVAITDPRKGVAKGIAPVAIGFVVMSLLTAFEFNCGAALNPARDLSPRLFTLFAGWGSEVFSFRDFNWFWVPIVGPHIGAILGVGLYVLCVELHWPTKIEQVFADDDENIGLTKRAKSEKL